MEIDGLRAIAVLAVIIYHANLQIAGVQIFQGGFFGVDVFFVLSGYLITGIIRKQMDSGTFSLLDFYWRRAKRILPALLIMLSATSIFAYWILLPDDLVTYAKSLQSALYFGSNHFFYGEDSYIADSSAYKPLLHTWSLGVEWQFYLVFPIIIWTFNKLFKQYLFGLLLSLAFISFQYANYITPNYPDMAFYLLPARAWELILGGIVTFYNRHNLLRIKKGSLEFIIFNALPILGLYLIAYSILFIDHEVLHPSFVTLLPVFGTCLILMFTHKNEITNDLLSTKPFVLIGLISYPLYLWHQPVFVFFRFLKHDHFKYEQLLLLVTISLLLAFLTYRFFENQYRRKQIGALHIGILITLTFTLSIFSHLIVKNEGYQDRLDGSIGKTYEMYKVPENRRLSDIDNAGIGYGGAERSQCNMRTVETACRFKDESWMTIGDSFAAQYDFALKQLLDKTGHGMITLSYDICPFVSPDIWFVSVAECTVVNRERLKEIAKLSEVKNIIVASNYDLFYEPKEKREDPITDGLKGFRGGNVIHSDISWQSYAENIKWLLEQGHNVYVIYSVPRPGIDVKKLVFKQLKEQKSTVAKFETVYSPGKTAFNYAMSKSTKLNSYLPDHPRLHKIYPTDILCNENGCEIINEHGGLYNSGGHLSYIGAKMILESFMPN